MASSSSSSPTRKKEPKLSVRSETRFKKSSYSSTKNKNLLLRETTILKKAFELSTLCDNDVCVIHYDRNGELVSTWPQDQSKVRDMAERFSKLSVQEKLKKSTNLSQFLNKKLIDGNKNIKFTQKVLDFEGTLVNLLQILQERAREILNSESEEPDQSRLAGTSEQNHNFLVSPNFFSKDLPSSSSSSSSLIDDPLKNLCPYGYVPDLQQPTGSSTNLLMSGCDVSILSTEQDMSRVVYNSAAATGSSNHQRQGKFSIFVFNHETATFTQLPDSVSSSFDQTYNLKP